MTMLLFCLCLVPLVLFPVILVFVLAAKQCLDLATASQVHPRAEEHDGKVEADEDPHDAKIAPVDKLVV